MSAERGDLAIPSNTRDNQQRAADPRWSIWVSANAGSGKTFVLTQRVLRLLLSGVDPQTILCLTYTKAAAAEMRRRVAERLARWAVMPEAALDDELVATEGRSYDEALRTRARTLFARALETPGGLRIQTIHAFCEAVLHRFPLEARVPFDFTVIEDDERAEMVLRARETVLAQGIGVAGAVETLFRTLSDDQIKKAIGEALADGRKLKAVLAQPAEAKRNLRRLVGVGQRHTHDVETELVEQTRLTAVNCRDLVRIFGGDPQKKGQLIHALAACNPDALTAADLRKVFLTDKGLPRARLLTAAQGAERPDLLALLEAEQARVVALDEELGKLALVERSAAFLDILGAIHTHYERSKRGQSRLDFDDLVERLADLFEREAGEWVRYKLDAGIDHILVDESQDTNGEQWRVVEAITAEFFAGAGAVGRPRSLFAVGDQKQSIYSFQGAQPELFGQTGRLYQRRADAAEAPFRPVPLHTSFRTLPEILDAVDRVTDSDAMREALLEETPVQHEAARTMRGGRVTLWPPFQQIASLDKSGEWPLTLPDATEQTAPRQVAERIAAEIKGWIDTRRPLTGRGRAVRADDVLILVQSRGPLFSEIIRALRRARIPTPGADRLGVTTHIAVTDLLALCDVLLNPADDLQLAALLRSPLFDVSEDDLFTLAAGRARGETLWQALAACTDRNCREASDKLARWRGELDFERPFEFLAQVLYAEGGLRRFHARLGTEVDDVLAELLELALAHEQTAQPSLQGFAIAMRARQGTVKRELPEAGAGVRVMTVHGAKGLEAPIVILADSATRPREQQVGKPLYLVLDAPGPLLVHANGASAHVEQTLALKTGIDRNLRNEYWRKLYVAMTRAEDELYLTGALTPGSDAGKQLEGSWYAAVETALRPSGKSELDAAGVETALVYPRDTVPPQPAGRLAAPLPAPTPLDLAPLPEPRIPILVSPSQAGRHVAALDALDTLAQQVGEARGARRRGIALHTLLQHLGRVERPLWPDIAAKALVALLPDQPEDHAGLATKAIAILSRPDLQPIFAAGSRAEVPFRLAARRDGEPVVLTGRIDRLVVDAEGVLVVDYKSDASVPPGPDDVPGNYRTQLGLYALVATQLFPGRPVRASILWTHLEILMNLPSDFLAAGAKGFTMR